MAKETVIEGKTCRWYIAGSIWVSNDGTKAYQPSKTRGIKESLTILTDQYGKKYVKHRFGYNVSISRAVLTSFQCQEPKDGKKYVVKHKDGNLSNCSIRNLEWELKHYQHNTSGSYDFTVGKDKYTAKSDGAVWKNNQQMEVRDELFDPDVDRFDSISPHVHIDGDRIEVDDIMRQSGFIQGDDAVLKNPVILHKDYDRWNFDTSNLEWCERDDERYVEYQEKIQEDKHNRRIELNPGKTLPSWW